jgi:trehalose-phosphatase
LIPSWNPEVPARCRARGHLHVFADLDGTLAPLAPTPDATTLTAPMLDVLAQLVARPRTTLTIISGRSVANLAQLVPIPGVEYIGNHGLERLAGGERSEHPAATRARPAITRIENAIEREVAATPGTHFEKKGITLSVHTKLSSATDHATLSALIARAVAAEPELRVTGGVRIIEVRPRNAPHKGDAILSALEMAHGRDWPFSCAALFIGDDLTDEDGFRALAGSGTTVIVRGRGSGQRDTAARFFARDPDDVLGLLRALVLS